MTGSDTPTPAPSATPARLAPAASPSDQAQRRAVQVALATGGVTALVAAIARTWTTNDAAAVMVGTLIGLLTGVVLAVTTVLQPARRELAGRRWLIRTLSDLSRVQREQEFRVLLEEGAAYDLPDVATACYIALLSAHRDRLEAAALRRELDTRVERRTRVAVAQLTRLSSTDELTGVLNRRGFEQAVAQLWNAAATRGRELAMLAIDLDHFKQLNDAHGHDKGDLALRAAGEVLRATLRDGDIAGRIGGDEFVVCLHGTGLAAAHAVGERCMALYAQHSTATGLKWPTMSIGIACAGEHRANDPTHLRRMADEALYDAKRGGRSACRAYRARARDRSEEAA